MKGFLWCAALVCFLMGSAAPSTHAQPDIVVTNISGVNNYASEGTGAGRIDAFSIGTVVCNRGDETAAWTGDTNQHAVIRQGMFRLRGGRFEQIGTSWVKHNYPAGNIPGTCSGDCSRPNEAGPELRAGCGDSNSASLNGDRINTGTSAEIDAFTGEFPHPTPHFIPQTGLDQRLQVHHYDLDFAANLGAIYFVQAHYVHPGDGTSGAGENNLTYRRIAFNAAQGDTFDASTASFPSRQAAAIQAWKDADPLVSLVEVRVPGEGLFLLAAKATQLLDGYWHYEYAVENVNSDRSGKSFRVLLPEGVIVRNAEFHDVDYHSGEPWQGTDWTSTIGINYIEWRTSDYDSNFAANALRWSTLYNFRFDANAGPAPTGIRIGLFKPGTPSALTASSIGPASGFVDCDADGIPDGCEIECAGCPAPCGASEDCDENGLPDECQPDCEPNGVADICDLRDCGIGDARCADCNGNGVPDRCDPDCDGDGLPDDCENQDVDADGVTNCDDLCPLTTPYGVCDPPATVTCFANGFCIPGLSPEACTASHGIVACGPGSACVDFVCPIPRCRGGCVLGDADGDGDIDLRDAAKMFDCFSGAVDSVHFIEPSADCLFHFDVDQDDDVDADDTRDMVIFMTGPG